MFYQALVVDRVIEGLFQNQDSLAAELEFMRSIQIGTLNGREDYDFPMASMTRVMRFSSTILMRLWVMFENKQQRVCPLWCLSN